MYRALTSARALAKWASIIATAVTGGLALLLFGDVVYRLFTGRSIRGGMEIVEFTIVVIGFLGLGHAEWAKTHIRVSVLADRLPPLVRRRLRAVVLGISAVLVAILTVYLTDAAISAFQTGKYRIGLLNFPEWPARFMTVAGGALWTLALAGSAISNAIGLEDPSDTHENSAGASL